MKYTQNGGVEIKGAVKMTSASTLDGNNLNTIINNISGVANQAQADADAAQDAADSASQAASQAQSQAEQASQDAQSASETASSADSNAIQALNIANNLSTGNGNLLRNSGFTGDYLDENVAPLSNVNDGTEMYSDPLDHWTATNVQVITSVDSVTGAAAVLSNGTLQQTLEIGVEQGKPYVFSFKGKGTSLHFYVGAYETTVQLTNTVQRYNIKFTAGSTSTAFAITDSSCTIMELQLIEGNIPFNNWMNNPKDNDKSLAYFQNYSYLLNAIINGNTQVLGGLILSQMLKVGNYRNQQLTEETGGMSGLYNSEDSPFLWGGGTMEQAFYTIAKYAENPNYEPSASELANLMAQFVVTHGGRAILNDIIARGVIIATSGIFKNIASPNGNFQIDANGDMKVRNATISGNMYAPLFVINDANFNQCTKETTDPYDRYRVIDLDVTGLNIQIDASVKTASLGICLPNEQKYNGAIVRLFNNTKNRIELYNSVTKEHRAQGTISTFILWSRSTYVEPYAYAMCQCEYFGVNTVVNNESYKEITHSDNMQKIADVTVGTKIKVVGGIVSGDDGYKVCGGTSSNPENILFKNTMNETTIKNKVRGFEQEYTVQQSPSCDAIYANVGNAVANIFVFKYNANSFYGWKNMNEMLYRGHQQVPSYMQFYSGKYGISVGYGLHIDNNGVLRFETWTRKDEDSDGIHRDG